MTEALALCVFLTLGRAPPPPPPPSEDDEDVGYAQPLRRPTGGFTYYFAQTNRADLTDGRTRVSVESGFAMPQEGYAPLRVTVDNREGPEQTVSVDYRSNAGRSGGFVRTNVRVQAGETQTLALPVPVIFSGGTVDVRGSPALGRVQTGHSYFTQTYGEQRAILTLSDAKGFQGFTGVEPSTSSADNVVATLEATALPTDGTALLGFAAVVAPRQGALRGLSEAQRQALERYVLTGGHLLVVGLKEDVPGFDALVEQSGAQTYGFGSVTLFEPGEHPRADQLVRDTVPVKPRGLPPEWERRSGRAHLLLPQATAPLGTFLFIIALFTLAIGPGSIVVARRRGPAALLFTIPLTAFVTSVLLIGYSLVADGFTVHAATYGVTWLDRARNRAVSVGLTAYYANLAPGEARFEFGTSVVGPSAQSGERHGASLDFRDGVKTGPDYLPSRQYREWGSVSVLPSRARVVVRQDGPRYFVQNALGAKAKRLEVHVGGGRYVAEDVRDGGEAVLRPLDEATDVAFAARDRFTREAIARVSGPDDGEFLALLDGAPFVPQGGLRVQLSDAVSFVRGGVDR